jgi:hypothetical protein
MRMFQIAKGTPVARHDNSRRELIYTVNAWTPGADMIFDLEEMVIDPAGILTSASGPRDQTIGGAYARGGYYGFSRGDFTIIARAEVVTVL